eukprot:Hpha_TRINITY_DN16186_c1_g1::TRINITY_DN16186_c1_g1_i2::g.3037::m.3037
MKKHKATMDRASSTAFPPHYILPTYSFDLTTPASPVLLLPRRASCATESGVRDGRRPCELGPKDVEGPTNDVEGPNEASAALVCNLPLEDLNDASRTGDPNDASLAADLPPVDRNDASRTGDLNDDSLATVFRKDPTGPSDSTD